MKFYKCLKCGNVVELINGNKPISCCGEPMVLLNANSVDASLEKHVPSITIEKENIVVTVGDVLHPMEEKHYIMWIALVSGDKITRVNLKPGDVPRTTFKYVKNSTVYAYCNLHGLWKKEI